MKSDILDSVAEELGASDAGSCDWYDESNLSALRAAVAKTEGR